MDTRFIDRHRKRVEHLLKNVPVDPTGTFGEVQSHWARYTCVVMYGYIENALQELLRIYTDERCPAEISNYVSVQLNFFHSATAENITQLFASFDKSWEASLKTFLTDERKSAINSVVRNRHRIAHGLDVTVTIHQLSQWYPRINEVIDHLHGVCTA